MALAPGRSIGPLQRLRPHWRHWRGRHGAGLARPPTPSSTR